MNFPRFLVAPFAIIAKDRRTIWSMYLYDLRSTTAGTQMGIGWNLLYPFFFFVNYVLVYRFILRVQFAGLSDWQYIMLILSGLIPALGFSQVIGAGIGTLNANSGLLKGTLIRPETLPLKSVLLCLPNFVVGMSIILLIGAFSANLHATIPLALILFVLYLMMCAGLLWLLSSLNVIFRDLSQIVTALLFPLMMMSPVAYPVERIPDALRPLMYFNPYFYFVPCFQDVLTLGRLPQPDIFIPFAVFSVVIFFLGHTVFNKLASAFLDNV